jgi:hypothetical protein
MVSKCKASYVVLEESRGEAGKLVMASVFIVRCSVEGP